MVANFGTFPTRWPRRPTVAIVGCGYVGKRLARLLVGRGHRVLAGSRAPERLRADLPPGTIPFRLDLDRHVGYEALAAAPLLVAAFPPPSLGSRDPRSARLAAALALHPPRRLVYLSSVGVYGDQGGDWITESCPTAPATERAQRRLDAEHQWRRFGKASGTVVSILRVAGIYGPNRLPVEAVRRGEAYRVDWPEPRYTNPIHVDDLVALIHITLEHGLPNRLYHACDGEQRLQGALQETVAEVLGQGRVPRLNPKEAPRVLSEIRLSFLRESRRCSNARVRREFSWFPRYRALREGVQSSLQEMGELSDSAV